MKKLLVLMLVLAAGGMASAGLLLQYDAATSEISVVMEEGGPNLISYYLEVTIDAGTLDASGVVLNPTGKTWMTAPKVVQSTDTLFSTTAADIKMFGGQGLGAGNAVLTGLLVNPPAEGAWVILTAKDAMWFDDASTLGELHRIFVPEPVSIMLLGLGGLFLRRRK